MNMAECARAFGTEHIEQLSMMLRLCQQDHITVLIEKLQRSAAEKSVADVTFSQPAEFDAEEEQLVTAVVKRDIGRLQELHKSGANTSLVFSIKLEDFLPGAPSHISQGITGEFFGMCTMCDGQPRNWASLLFLAMDLRFPQGAQLLHQYEVTTTYSTPEKLARGITAPQMIDVGGQQTCMMLVCWAIEQGQAGIDFLANLLLEHGFPSDDEFGTPQFAAVNSCNMDAVALLLACGTRQATSDGSLLSTAIELAVSDPDCMVETRPKKKKNKNKNKTKGTETTPPPSPPSPTLQLARFLTMHVEWYNDENWDDQLGPRPDCSVQLHGLGYAPFFPTDVVRLCLRLGVCSDPESTKPTGDAWLTELQKAALLCKNFTGLAGGSTPGADLVLLAAQPWGLHNHHLFTDQSRATVPYLLWIGKQLVESQSCLMNSNHLWITAVCPFLVVNSGGYACPPRVPFPGWEKFMR
jgi:hypothetical protein